MRHRFFETAFTPAVQTEQAKHGSRAGYERLASAPAAADETGLTDAEIDFLAERNSFYLGTVSEFGWPYVQHRGGPAGFVRVLDPLTLAWADFSGNRQYVSIGNTAVNDRVALFFMDYPARARLKVLGRMSTTEVGDRPEMAEHIEMTGYGAKVEHIIQVRIEAFDWNCPQHITPRFTVDQVEKAVAPLRRQIAELQARLAAASVT